MKARLNENNSRFAVVKMAGHGGGVISFHNSLNAAKAAERKGRLTDCTCGCCEIVPITDDASEELSKNGYWVMYKYNQLPVYDPDLSYGITCK